jgi:putative transposase
MGIEARRPGAGTLVHSDHGSQYTSWTFSQRVRRASCPLDRVRGNAFNNAMAESFWARVQTELLNTRRWRTLVEAVHRDFDWIEAF